MRLVVDARHSGAPRAGTKLLVVLVAAGTGLSLQATGARASPDDNWAAVEISRGQAEREAGERGRSRRAAERDSDDDGYRPQRSGPIKKRTAQRSARKERRVASLAPMPAPDPARQSSAANTPRPQAKAKAPKPNGLGTMVASLGRDLFVAPEPKELPSLFGGPIRWVARADCLVTPLQGVLNQVAALFGALQVNSTCRSPRHNRKVGGARRSQHLTGSAVDFRIGGGNSKDVLNFLRAQKVVGGYKHYGRGVFHIDTGPRRTW